MNMSQGSPRAKLPQKPPKPRVKKRVEKRQPALRRLKGVCGSRHELDEDLNVRMISLAIAAGANLRMAMPYFLQKVAPDFDDQINLLDIEDGSALDLWRSQHNQSDLERVLELKRGLQAQDAFYKDRFCLYPWRTGGFGTCSEDHKKQIANTAWKELRIVSLAVPDQRLVREVLQLWAISSGVWDEEMFRNYMKHVYSRVCIRRHDCLQKLLHQPDEFGNSFMHYMVRDASVNRLRSLQNLTKLFQEATQFDGSRERSELSGWQQNEFNEQMFSVLFPPTENLVSFISMETQELFEKTWEHLELSPLYAIVGSAMDEHGDIGLVFDAYKPRVILDVAKRLVDLEESNICRPKRARAGAGASDFLPEARRRELLDKMVEAIALSRKPADDSEKELKHLIKLIELARVCETEWPASVKIFEKLVSTIGPEAAERKQRYVTELYRLTAPNSEKVAQFTTANNSALMRYLAWGALARWPHIPETFADIVGWYRYAVLFWVFLMVAHVFYSFFVVKAAPMTPQKRSDRNKKTDEEADTSHDCTVFLPPLFDGWGHTIFYGILCVPFGSSVPTDAFFTDLCNHGASLRANTAMSKTTLLTIFLRIIVFALFVWFRVSRDMRPWYRYTVVRIVFDIWVASAAYQWAASTSRVTHLLSSAFRKKGDDQEDVLSAKKLQESYLKRNQASVGRDEQSSSRCRIQGEDNASPNDDWEKRLWVYHTKIESRADKLRRSNFRFFLVFLGIAVSWALTIIPYLVLRMATEPCNPTPELPNMAWDCLKWPFRVGTGTYHRLLHDRGSVLRGETWVVVLADICEFGFQAYAINHITQYAISIAIVLRSAQQLFKCFHDHFPHELCVSSVKYTDTWIYERRLILMRHVFAWEVLRPTFQFHALVCLFNIYNFARRVAANFMTASINFTAGVHPWIFADPFLVRDGLFIVFGVFPVFIFLYVCGQVHDITQKHWKKLATMFSDQSIGHPVRRALNTVRLDLHNVEPTLSVFGLKVTNMTVFAVGVVIIMAATDVIVVD